MYNARQSLLEVWLLNTDLYLGIEYNCSDPGVHFVSHKANILDLNRTWKNMIEGKRRNSQ